MYDKYICTVTPRATAKAEQYVKRRQFAVMADSLTQAKQRAVETYTRYTGIKRSLYKLNVEKLNEATDHIMNADGDILELSKSEAQTNPKADDKQLKKQQSNKQKGGKQKGGKQKGGKQKYDYETTRAFCLISYIDGEVLEEWVASQPWVHHWAMAYHDKDLEEDGTPKPPHTHVLLYTYHDKTSSAIKKRFDKFSLVHYTAKGETPQNTLSQSCESMSMMWRYLTHKDDPDKYPYPDSILRCDFLWYWLKLENDYDKTCAKENAGLAIVNDILAGVPTMELIERYGREFIIYRTRYYEAVRAHLSERYNNNKNNDLIQTCLEASRFSKQQVYLFWQILDYIQTECLINHGLDVDLITGEAQLPKVALSERIN